MCYFNEKNQNCCKTYKVISNSLLPQLWSVQPVMPCIWALDPCAGHQFRRTDPHNHTTTSPIFATAGDPCKTARFPSWTVNINTYLTTSCIGLFHWISQTVQSKVVGRVLTNVSPDLIHRRWIHGLVYTTEADRSFGWLQAWTLTLRKVLRLLSGSLMLLPISSQWKMILQV